MVDVAPLMFVQLEPLFSESCHCTVGVGLPDAAAENVAVDPEATLTLTGCVVTFGAAVAAVTVSRALFVVALPAEFVNTALNRAPFCEASAAPRFSDAEVAPVSSDQLSRC